LSLKLKKSRHGSPNFYIRGTVLGIRIDESTGVSDRKAAEEIRIRREQQLMTQAIRGVGAVMTFADAALDYMSNDGDEAHLIPLIQLMGEMLVDSIGQDEVDAVAKKLSKSKSGRVKSPATLNRQVYTPVSAVLHHAASKRWCSKPVLNRPSQPKGRVRSLSFAEAETLIASAAPHLRPLVVFLLLTGARISEALYLDWKDVELAEERLTFRNTKNGDHRGIRIHRRVKELLAAMPHRTGAVFRRPDGQPYASRNGLGGGQVKTAWKSMLKAANIRDFTPHDCRHTFASWHYAQHRNPLALMEYCGWKTHSMVARYAHINPNDLGASIDLIGQDLSASGGISGEVFPRNAEILKLVSGL